MKALEKELVESSPSMIMPPPLFNGYATDIVYMQEEDLSNGALWWCIAHLYKSICYHATCVLWIMKYFICILNFHD
jgi:hypothetical protein